MPGSLRQRIAIIRKDRHIASAWVKPKRLIRKGGAWWFHHRGADYRWGGPFYTFEYRLVRSIGVKRYVGVQRIYLEGNPVPFYFEEDDKMKELSETAFAVFNVTDSDLPEKLMRPRKVDLVLVILVGLIALAIGAIIGMRVGPGVPVP